MGKIERQDNTMGKIEKQRQYNTMGKIKGKTIQWAK